MRDQALINFDGRKRRRFRRRRNWGRIVLRSLTVVAIIGSLVGGFILFRDLTSPNAVQLQVLGADGEPLRGAVISLESGKSTTTVEGGIAFLSFDAPARLAVVASGYKDATYRVDTVPKNSPLGLQMEPWVLSGRVTDTNGNGVVGAAVTVGSKSVRTEQFGSFEIVAAAPGMVQVSKAAWESTEVEWAGGEGRLDVTMEPFAVRALRVEGDAARLDSKFDELLRLADASTVNALVFDTKNEQGAVMYLSNVPEANDIGASFDVYDPERRLAQAREHGLYTITRIVTFQDDYYARAEPDHAISDVSTGGIWTNQSDLGWLDPTDPASWEYPISLGVEACRLGFDEVQFDYVRFPTDGDISTTVYDDGTVVDEAVRIDYIAGFLASARERIGRHGCAVSADIFAIVLSVRNDQGLGQKVEELSHSVDAVSPMIYPSHYTNGWLGLDEPNDHPAEVVSEALGSGIHRLEGGALMRPWLQGFGWEASEILESISVAEANGLGWMLWNPLSDYQESWLPRE
jgi:hypothetical protein